MELLKVSCMLVSTVSLSVVSWKRPMGRSGMKDS